MVGFLIACAGGGGPGADPVGAPSPLPPDLPPIQVVSEVATAHLAGEFQVDAVSVVPDVTGDGVSDLLVAATGGGLELLVLSGAALAAGDSDWLGTAQVAVLHGFPDSEGIGAVAADTRGDGALELVVVHADGLLVLDTPLAGRIDVGRGVQVLDLATPTHVGLVGTEPPALVLTGTYLDAPEAWLFPLPLPAALVADETEARIRSSSWDAVHAFREVALPWVRGPADPVLWSDGAGVSAVDGMAGEVNVGLVVPGEGRFRVADVEVVAGLGRVGEPADRYAWQGCHPETGACGLLFAPASALAGSLDAYAAWDAADTAILSDGDRWEPLTVFPADDGSGREDLLFRPSAGASWFAVAGDLVGAWNPVSVGPGVLARWEVERDARDTVLVADLDQTPPVDFVFVGPGDIFVVTRAD